MERTAYDTRAWRSLPRTSCVIERLFGAAAGPCRGDIHRHHVDPEDEGSRTLEVCTAHHSTLHAALRRILTPPEWKRCPHNPGTHRYPEGKRECERRLNAA